MTPVYFPFTYMSGPAVEAVSACFPQIFVYQPSRRNVPEEMRKWVERDILRIRVPVEGDEEKIDALMRDYADWVALHQGGETAFLKSLGDTIPFFDESSTARIRSDIRRKISTETAGNKTDAETPDALFQARLFLRIAQEMDMQKSSLIQDFLHLEAMEQNLFEALRGDDAFVHLGRMEAKRFQADDPGNFMTRERIIAWTRLVQQDFGQAGSRFSGLFVTTSRSVIDQLMALDPAMQPVLDVDAMPVCENRTEEMERWQDRLMGHLAMLVEKPWPLPADAVVEPFPDRGCVKRASLTIYIAPGVSPEKFFGRLVKNAGPQPAGQDGGGRLNNTVVGLVQF